MVSGMHIDQTWRLVLSDLRDRGRIAKSEFDNFLEPTRLLALDKEAGTAVVATSDTFRVERLDKKYREKIVSSLHAVTGKKLQIEFSVLEGLLDEAGYAAHIG